MAESKKSRTAGATGLVRRAVGAVATGVVGVLVVRSAEGRELPRRAAVAVTKLGILGARRAEVAVEKTRLAAGDVRARAYADLGETAPPPADRAAGHDHSH